MRTLHPASAPFSTPPLPFPRKATSTVEWLLESLHALGVEEAFGLTGGAIAPLTHALARSSLRTYHFRHECGAGYAALEASLASGRPSLLYVTTGPGLTNALTALSAARWEGGKILMISGATPSAQRQRWACQETSALTLPLENFFSSSPLFDVAAMVESTGELEALMHRLAQGWTRPGAWLGHLSLSIPLQSAPAPRRTFRAPSDPALPTADSRVLAEVAHALGNERSVLWVGHGARFASTQVRMLAERLGTPVMVSPRAKGVFSERHPLYLGTSGLGGHQEVEAYFARTRPAYVLVLGSRLSEPTSFWNPALVPGKAFIHVDMDPQVPGSAYPEAETWAIQAEVGAFLDGLLSRLPSASLRPLVAMQGPLPPEPPKVQGEGAVRPQSLMAALQSVVVDGSDATVVAESGNAFAWANNLLRFTEPERYRVSTGFGAMGHFANGVVGAALATGRKAVALVGDGSMLMGTELNSAVQYRAPAVWIVLNDASYSMVDQGMRALGLTPLPTGMPRVDFVALARACGADGIRVEQESQLKDAMIAAMAAEGPFVIDVQLDNSETTPWMRRIRSLISQGIDDEGDA